MEFFFGDSASDGSDFDAADGNSYKDYYSDDDDLFSLDDVSHSEVRDIREAWNAQTPISEPLNPTEINTENGPKSSNPLSATRITRMMKVMKFQKGHQLLITI